MLLVLLDRKINIIQIHFHNPHSRNQTISVIERHLYIKSPLLWHGHQWNHLMSHNREITMQTKQKFIHIEEVKKYMSGVDIVSRREVELIVSIIKGPCNKFHDNLLPFYIVVSGSMVHYTVHSTQLLVIINFLFFHLGI